MLTLKKVNKHLHENGMPEDIELVKGEGYYYFAGGNTYAWKETGVYVYRLNHLSLEGYLDAYNELKEG